MKDIELNLNRIHNTYLIHNEVGDFRITHRLNSIDTELKRYSISYAEFDNKFRLALHDIKLFKDLKSFKDYYHKYNNKFYDNIEDLERDINTIQKDFQEEGIGKITVKVNERFKDLDSWVKDDEERYYAEFIVKRYE